jgi:transposase
MRLQASVSGGVFLTRIPTRENSEASWNIHARLSDQQWERVRTALQGNVKAHAKSRANTRQFVESVLWMAHNPARWADIPIKVNASWHACCVRFGRWASEGQWDRVIDAIPDLPETGLLLRVMVQRHLDTKLRQLSAKRLDEMRKKGEHV